MLTRLRTRWFAGGAAMLLILAMSGAALGADNAGESAAAPDGDATIALVVDTTATFEDVDGDGIDDDCDAEVAADPEAAATAETAADLDGDGTISVSEAARSGRTGGANCNHGGYVSGVAQDQCDADTEPEADVDQAVTVSLTADEADEDSDGADEDAPKDEDADAAEDCTDDPAAPEAATTTPCVEVPAPPFDPAIFTGPGAFGAYVSSVAKSDAVGGKNCNHGGAVSAAVKAAKAAARAERDAAKAAARAERDAAKAERQANKALAKAVRNATKQSKGKGHGNGH